MTEESEEREMKRRPISKMDYQVHLVVHRGRSVYDNIILKSHDVIPYQNNKIQIEKNADGDDCAECRKVIQLQLNKKGLNSHLVSLYVSTLRRSDLYRISAMRMLIRFSKQKVPRNEKWIIFIKLRNPRKHFIDYAWSERITRLATEKREIDHAMSWLSTLGGAFSALGEEIPYCAEVAGKISVKQFKLAYRLGDPLLEARCKLYAALSLIQRGDLKTPKRMLRDIYRFGIHEKDVRLQNMCQGVWAKLKYIITAGGGN
ncbi:uncharacterized protein F58A4.6 isoform X2 [Belonocnema kinseyi]|nr:uncharacterized protein F58A4.6 isoform X2 [Belonocnema kinseyi]XP_033208021.1 uncharacterized protein F58A4.6 isoform X2 [Belonocnema kinseyi]